MSVAPMESSIQLWKVVTSQETLNQKQPGSLLSQILEPQKQGDNEYLLF